MKVKRSGKTVYGVELTAAEERAFNLEARRRLAEHTRQHELEIEAIVIRQLRRMTGWGEVRLRRFYNGFDSELVKLVNRYEMEECDSAWLCTQELLSEGLDIEKWHKERWPNEKYDIK